MSKKSIVKSISLVLSVLILLTVLPFGAFAAEANAVKPELTPEIATTPSDVTVLDEDVSSTEKWTMRESSLSSDIDFDSESTPEPLSQTELTTIIENGKMERVSADNVPDVVGFETAKSRNHVARAYQKEKDDLNSLVFLNEDGTYTKYVYDYPVKFTDTDGKIKDTSLQVVSDSKGGYKRKQGNSTANFSEKMTDGISLSDGELSVSLVPRQPTIVRPKPDLSQVASKKLNSLLLSTDKVNFLDNKTVSYYYNDSTTLEYSLTYLGFKEDIVVSEYTGQTEYVFTLKTNGLALTENDGNFYLTDEQGNIKVSLGQVIIFTADERNNTFGSMTAETVTENQEYTVTIHVDADYLKDEKTVYPIRIDPTLELVNTDNSLVEDIVINSDNTVSNRYTEALKVGKNSNGTYSRILIKFNYDFGSFADGPLKIHRAYVEMRDLMCQPESMTVMSEMFLGTNWSESSEWSSFERGTHTHYMASMPIYYDKGNAFTEKHRYSISILDAMKYWVAEANNTPNYYQESPQGGIMIKAYDEVEQGNTAITKYFGSSNHPTSAYRPSLSVTYYDLHTQYSDPFGHLDAVTSNSIRGWVWCVDLPEQSVPVTIYLTNQTTGEAYPGITLSGNETALYRPDVHSAGYGTGKYGFNYAIDWSKYSSGKYSITAKWHSMNGTGLEYNLFNAPKEYVNYPYDSGEYYINNKEHGRYLKHENNLLGVESGLLADLGSKIKWTLTKYNYGYLIQNNQSAYLTVVSDAVTFRQSTSGLTTEHIWDLIYDGGYCLRNRHSGKYLYTDGTQLLLDNTTGGFNNVQNREHIWRIVDVNQYRPSGVHRELTDETTARLLVLGVGTTNTLSLEYAFDNELWASSDDFVFIDTQNPAIARITDEGKIIGVSVGNTTATIRHKVTNLVLSVNVCVCKKTRRIKVIYDHSILVRFNHKTSDKVCDAINSSIGYVAEQYAQLLNIALLHDELQLYTSQIDSCKINVTANNINVFCEEHSNLTAIKAEIESNFPSIDGEIIIFMSMHTILNDEISTDEYDEITYNRSNSDGNYVYLLGRVTNMKDSHYDLFHEIAHTFGALDHYHDVHNVNGVSACRNKDRCNNDNCNPNTQYDLPCIMGTNKEQGTDTSQIDGICDSCKNDISAYFS